MKKIIILILKISFIVLIIAWVTMVVIDYFRARDMVRPVFCFSEKNAQVEEGKYYECTSFGYKYYTLEKEDGTKEYGFRSILSGSPVEVK